MAENGNSEEGLSVKQQVFLTALLTPYDIQTSAKVAGVSERQAHRWIRQEHFVKAMKEAQQELYDASLRKLQSLQTDVLSALEKHLRADVDPSAGTHLRAAIYLHSQGTQNQQIQELQAQVTELKTMLTAMKDNAK